jgi:nucleoside-specific outer membrane channel protein Tsx
MKGIKIALLTTVAASTAFAGDFIQWTDTSLTGLYGTGFEIDPEDQITLTIEHANGWKWGDFFWFNDFIYFNGDDAGVNGAQGSSTYYGEISPRVSFGKMLNKDLSVLFIKDWLIAGCYEYGEDEFGEDFGIQNYLIGGGVDLDVPGFDFVQLNVYQRIPDTGEGETIQITPVWKITFPMGKSSFICDGFIDWVVNSDGGYSENLHIVPQLKVDLGAFMGMKKGALLAGAELDYWKNKYGIEDGTDPFVPDTDQFAYSGIVQYHF